MKQVIFVRIARVPVVMRQRHVAIDRARDLDNLIPVIQRALVVAMRRKKFPRLLMLVLISSIVSLQAACVTGRRTFELPVAAREVPPASKGRVYIDTIMDDRQLQNRPPDPSTPSVNGDVKTLSAAQKEQMIGRQRNGCGMAMGDIALVEGDSVTKKVRQLIEQDLARSGYGSGSAPSAADRVTVSLNHFWAWTTPGLVSLTFEARISCAVSVTSPSGTQVSLVNGYGLNHGQMAKNGNWQGAYAAAFEDFMSNFVPQAPGMGLQ